jgi:hypothetical protein
MGNIIENLITLTFLYVGIFLIQVIVLPLLSFWVLVKMVNSLFPTGIPAMGIASHGLDKGSGNK